jgi:hypothetical protein
LADYRSQMEKSILILRCCLSGARSLRFAKGLLPGAEIHIHDAGRFALQEKPGEIAKLVGDFWDARSVNQQSSSNERDGSRIGIGGRS